MQKFKIHWLYGVIILFSQNVWSAIPTKVFPKTITVGVIDTGVDLKHTYLQKSLWNNPGEMGLDSQNRDKSTNGIDDDGNGYEDDVHGWNFLRENGDIEDLHGHGTHVSGLIVSHGLEPVKGETPDLQVKIMVLKNYHLKPEQNLNATVEAIKYAVDNNVDIINFSGGGALPSRDEYAALLQAQKKNIWVVTAAGNEGHNSDVDGFYPASYGLKNIIAVGSTDSFGLRLPSSNYGSHVKFMIPGEQVFSALPQNHWGRLTGTSQAAARLTGYLAYTLLGGGEDNFGQNVMERVQQLVSSKK